MSDTTTLYLSHSANRRDDPDWFIVEPRNAPESLRAQVEGLLRAGRRVLSIAIWDLGGQVTYELTDLPAEMQALALDEMKYRGQS